MLNKIVLRQGRKLTQTRGLLRVATDRRAFGSKVTLNRSKSPSDKKQQKRNFESSERLCADAGHATNTLANGTDIWLPKTCGFIGSGQMADALLTGFIAKKAFSSENVAVSDISQDRLDYMQGKFGVKATLSNIDLLTELRIIVLSVKPQVMDAVLQEISPHIGQEHLIVSVAAGYPVSRIEEFIGSDKRVVRVMPNTPSKIGAGASGFCLGSTATEEDSRTVKLMMSAVGESFEVTESQLDAVTGVSGSGPAYVFLMIEAMADGGVRMGLPRDISLKLAAQTVMGSAKMCLETGQHPGVLKDAVASPGGTTICAIEKLEQLGFRSAAMSAVVAAAEKSIALQQKK